MGILLYSALVVDGNMIYMLQEVGDVPQSSLALHDFFLFFDCVYLFAKVTRRETQLILFLFFQMYCTFRHNHCITQAGRLMRECIA